MSHRIRSRPGCQCPGFSHPSRVMPEQSLSAPIGPLFGTQQKKAFKE